MKESTKLSQQETARSLRPIAVVTGTSSGFGLYTSVALAKAGYDVVATMRNLDRKENLLREATVEGVLEYIHVLPLDITDHDSIAATFDMVRTQYRRVDLLVNNAGYAAGGCVEEVGMDEWRAQLEVNFFGTVAVTRAVLPLMRGQGSGTIVNVSSTSGRYAFPGYGPYAASKFAVEGFTESLRLEMLPFGVYVVLVEPGAFKTDIWEKGFATFPIHKASPYYTLLKNVLQFSKRASDTAPHPQGVADQIVNIAHTRKPKLRYALGKGNTSLRLIRLLPWKWYEWIILFVLRK